MSAINKEELKRLKEENRETVDRVKALVKEQNADVRAIEGCLEGEGATVPAISEATGLPTEKVLWYVATLRKYGRVAEGESDGGYYLYKKA